MEDDNRVFRWILGWLSNPVPAAFALIVLLLSGVTGGILILLGVILDFDSLGVMISLFEAGASLLLVSITAAYVALTYRLVQESAEAREQENAPIITLDHNEAATPIIENVGNGPASKIDIEIKFKPGDGSYEYFIWHLRAGEHRMLQDDILDNIYYEDGDENDYEVIEVVGSCFDGFGNEWPINWEYEYSRFRESLMNRGKLQ